MIRVEINEERRELSETSPDWIVQQIKERQRRSIPVCVKVFVNMDNVNVALSCGECPQGSTGGGRVPNPKEGEILSLWEKFGCSKNPINSGNIIAFLKHIN
ncbi:hypothetical protein [Vibrio parahaemolyticus]|uniref:hypothetical protein n=1 Tax=Vibrio parahaemolyticus TaxID=670 RepID=UPI001E3CB181|nr:hypothetical protein [Vibrio parahaemolyticus]